MPASISSGDASLHTQVRQLDAHLQKLLIWAQQLDQQKRLGKPQHWFDSALFSSHSPYLADYVAESLRHLTHLQLHYAGLSAAALQRLTLRINEQVAALTQAFRNREIRQPVSQLARTKAVVKQISENSQQLYQQLSEYQQFEQRLLDMVQLAQHAKGGDATQRVLALHARLGRCRRAIDDVEQRIQRLETTKRH